MAKNMQPILKRCKTLGLSPAVLGYSKETKRNPKQSRRKQSEYGMQLAEKQKVLQEVQDKLAAGEDFDTLMKQYGEDPGMESNPEGYLIDQYGATLDGSYMVSEFTEGATALAVGETTAQPVETSYGWHIITRVPATDEDYAEARLAVIYEMTGEDINTLISTWIDEADVTYPDGHEELKITDVLGEEAAAPSLDDLMGGASSTEE